MTTTNKRPMSMRDRLAQFRTESPGAGGPFPDLTAQLLEGGSWQPGESTEAGRVFVLETGSFT